MSWKFWEKKGDETQEKLSGPKDITDPVGRCLVLKMGQDPDWVWKLKVVTRHKEGEKDIFYVRVFSAEDTSMKKVNVKNYLTLDEHQELILFEGWFNKKTLEAEVHAVSQPSSKAA